MPRREKIDVTPEVEEWRKANPIRLWIDSLPEGVGFRKIIKATGVTRSGVYCWMHGKSLPPADTLLDLCTIIGVGYRTYIRWWREYPKPQASATPEAQGCEAK